MRITASFLLWCVCLMWAQDRPAFEVASIKVHRDEPGPFRASAASGPAGITYTNLNLKGCIRSAYGFESYRISGGPDWLTTERYDIVAKAASAAPKAQLMLMLQTLLEDRFHLKVHRETKDMPVYGLVPGKNGFKLRPGKPDGETEIGGAAHFINSRGMTMKQLASALSQIKSDRPVLDMTGIAGVFDITLDFVEGDDNGPDILTAVQEQLGLKLEARKSPLEILVIDHAEKASGN